MIIYEFSVMKILSMKTNALLENILPIIFVNLVRKFAVRVKVEGE